MDKFLRNNFLEEQLHKTARAIFLKKKDLLFEKNKHSVVIALKHVVLLYISVAFTKIFRFHHKEPFKKYDYPQIESQGYGWDHKPVVSFNCLLSFIFSE